MSAQEKAAPLVELRTMPTAAARRVYIGDMYWDISHREIALGAVLLYRDGRHDCYECAHSVLSMSGLEAIFRLDATGAALARARAQRILDIRAAMDAARQSKPASEAVADIITERQRQVEAEGLTPQRDDSYQYGELAYAAAAYASHAANRHGQIDIRVGRRENWKNGGWCSIASLLWPWVAEWWKPTTPRRDLVKAGALIVAEIERIDRRAAADSTDPMFAEVEAAE